MVQWARSPDDALLVLVATARGLGYDPARLTARQALDTWVRAARVPFRVPPGAEVDCLAYRLGADGDTLRLALLRRIACRDGAAHRELTCEVVWALTPELQGVGAVGERCPWPPASPARHAWTAALGARPEWRLLEAAPATRVDVVLS